MNDPTEFRPFVEYMLFNVVSRHLLPSHRTCGTIDQIDVESGEGDDAGNLDYVLGHYDDPETLWVNWDGEVVERDETAPPIPPPYIPPPEPEAERPLALQLIAGVRLLVDGWDVAGLERSTGLSLAFVADVDTVWVFFDTEQPDTDYIVMPPDGVTKFTDHIEITRPGLAAVSLIVQRVQ